MDGLGLFLVDPTSFDVYHCFLLCMAMTSMLMVYAVIGEIDNDERNPDYRRI